jgi:hypothetical protein
MRSGLMKRDTANFGALRSTWKAFASATDGSKSFGTSKLVVHAAAQAQHAANYVLGKLPTAI